MDRALQEFTFELMRHAAEQGLSKVTVTEGNFSITVENTPVEAAAVAPTAAAPAAAPGCGTRKVLRSRKKKAIPVRLSLRHWLAHSMRRMHRRSRRLFLSAIP